MNDIFDKIEANESVINGFEIKHKFRIKLTFDEIINIGNTIKKKWQKLFNSY